MKQLKNTETYYRVPHYILVLPPVSVVGSIVEAVKALTCCERVVYSLVGIITLAVVQVAGIRLLNTKYGLAEKIKSPFWLALFTGIPLGFFDAQVIVFWEGVYLGLPAEELASILNFTILSMEFAFILTALIYIPVIIRTSVSKVISLLDISSFLYIVLIVAAGTIRFVDVDTLYYPSEIVVGLFFLLIFEPLAPSRWGWTEEDEELRWICCK